MTSIETLLFGQGIRSLKPGLLIYNEVQHPVLEQQVPLGLIPHVQTRLLARHLRGDLKEYMPFLYR